jgi:lactoylglutathione lyase
MGQVVANASMSLDGYIAKDDNTITDPDGYRMELVQWPVGHANDMTEADF